MKMFNRLSKKGMSLETLVGLIMLSIFLILSVLILYYSGLLSEFVYTLQYGICTTSAWAKGILINTFWPIIAILIAVMMIFMMVTSIAGAAKAPLIMFLVAVALGSILSHVPLLCPMQQDVVGAPDNPAPVDDALERIARYTADCWMAMGESRYHPLWGKTNPRPYAMVKIRGIKEEINFTQVYSDMVERTVVDRVQVDSLTNDDINYREEKEINEVEYIIEADQTGQGTGGDNTVTFNVSCPVRNTQEIVNITSEDRETEVLDIFIYYDENNNDPYFNATYYSPKYKLGLGEGPRKRRKLNLMLYCEDLQGQAGNEVGRWGDCKLTNGTKIYIMYRDSHPLDGKVLPGIGYDSPICDMEDGDFLDFEVRNLELEKKDNIIWCVDN